MEKATRSEILEGDAADNESKAAHYAAIYAADRTAAWANIEAKRRARSARLQREEADRYRDDLTVYTF